MQLIFNRGTAGGNRRFSVHDINLYVHYDLMCPQDLVFNAILVFLDRSANTIFT
jgi:hypothetical protein